MKCNQVSDNLIFYYYNELEHSKMQEIKKHLDTCEKCRMEYNKLALVLDYAQKEKEFKASDNLWTKISMNIGYQQPHEHNNSKLITYFQAVAIAAAIAIAVFLGTLIGSTYADKYYLANQTNLSYDEELLMNPYITLEEEYLFAFY